MQTTKRSWKHIWALLSRTNKEEYIHNVYKLPSIERMVHLHAAADHPLEDTWVKAVGHGNYNLWPLISTKNVRKDFLELEETQLGHLQGQWQGVQSTCLKQPANISPHPGIEKKHNICVHVYKLSQENCLTATIYADQIGDFPYISSQGNRSIMLLHHVNNNSFWVSPSKIRERACSLPHKHKHLNKCASRE